MTGVAMSTEDGMADIAEGVADYRQTQLHAVADQLADNPNDAHLRTTLHAVMLDDAELRGFTTKIAGETEISDAHDTDQQRQFWTNLLAEGAKAGPDQAAHRRDRRRARDRPGHWRDQQRLGQHRQRRRGRRGRSTPPTASAR